MGLVVLTNPGGRSDWAWAMVLIRQNNDATMYRLIMLVGPLKTYL